MNSTRTRSGTTAAARVATLTALAVLAGGPLVGTASAASASSATAGVSAQSRTTDFGYLTRLRTTTQGTTLTFDRAVLHTGPAAAAERAARGLEPDGPDFFIANDNPRLRTYRLAPGVVVRGSQLLTGSPQARTVPLSTLRRHLERRGTAGVPFTLTFDRRGRVSVVEEVYLS